MPDLVLVEYIKNCVKEKYSVDKIYEELIDNGYSTSEISNTLKYLKIEDPTPQKRFANEDENTQKRIEEETRKRNLVNLIQTGYTPAQIELDLITSGMDRQKALETVATLIPPYKDKIEFIGYYIQSLRNSGYTLEHIRMALRKSDVPDMIVRNAGDANVIAEIINDSKREKEMANYSLGEVQRLYLALFNPKLMFAISKAEYKFIKPIMEVFRLQVITTIVITFIKLWQVYQEHGININAINWAEIGLKYIQEMEVFLKIFGFQLGLVVACALILKIASILTLEKLKFVETLRIAAYSYIPAFLFFIVALVLNPLEIDKSNIFIFSFLIFSIWRMVTMLFGIHYYLRTTKIITLSLVFIAGGFSIACELLLGYWSLLTLTHFQ